MLRISVVNKRIILATILGISLACFGDKTTAAGLHKLSAHVRPLAKELTPVGRLPGSTRLKLAIGLPVRNRLALDQLVESLYDPGSARFHQFLTPDQFSERFGPTKEDYQALIEFAQANGLAVRSQHSNRMVLELEGEVGSIERMLHTALRIYQHPTEKRTFYAPDAEPSIDLAVTLLDIEGLDDYAQPRPMCLKRSTPAALQTGSAPDGSLRGNDFRTAYAPGVRLDGSGQSVGLLEFDGYYTNDIALYEQDAAIHAVPLQNVILSGVSGAAGTNNAEVALDIEMAISMAPGLSKVIIYEARFPNAILSKMATDNAAKQLSSSWMFPINSTTEQLYTQFSVQGQAMFQASGDGDAYYYDVYPPADDPQLTIVGGTILTTSGPGGAWLSESTWNWYNVGQGFGGSGGGVSTAYPLPSWQKGIDMTANQGSIFMRNLPDVAFAADKIWVRDNNGGTESVAGTSAAAPLWAGFMALVNQQAVALGGTSLGFFNPSLYGLAKGAKYATCFHDIIVGNNTNNESPTKFFAVAGYDLCTGWGTPTGQALINALTGVTNVAPAFVAPRFAGPAANLTQAYSASISAQASDPDPGDKLTFTKVSGPAWLIVAANGTLSGTPGLANLGTNTFGVKVTDAGGLSASATLVITVVAAPRFLNDPFFEPMANAGRAYSETVSTNAVDPNPGTTLTFSKTGGPAWLSVGSDGSLAGTPSNSDAGTNSFALNVTDSGGITDSATMYLLVNGAPFFFANTLLEPEANQGRAYSSTIASQARDPNPGDILTFAKLGGPAWLNVANNGALSGTPGKSDVGTNIFQVQVTDSKGLTNSATMDVYVIALTPIRLQIATFQNQFYLSWAGGAGSYQVQIAGDLAKPVWVNFGQPITNQSLVLPITKSTLFYRIEAQ